MKKLYIQPSIEIEAIETSDILEGSPWNVNQDDFGGNQGGGTNTVVDGNLSGDDGSGGFGEAKQSTFIWDEEF